MDTFADQPDHYGAYEGFLDLGKHFLGDINTLKTGFWGYVTHSMAKVAADSAFQRNMMYRELFLNTASFPASIYNAAKIYNYEVQNTIPSYSRILMTFKENDLNLMIDDSGENNQVTISNSQVVNMGDIPFIFTAPVTSLRETDAISLRTIPVQDTIFQLRIAIFVPLSRMSMEKGGSALKSIYARRKKGQMNSPSCLPIRLIPQDTRSTISILKILPHSPWSTILLLEEQEISTCISMILSYRKNRNTDTSDISQKGLRSCSPHFPNEFRPEYNSRLILTYFTSLGERGNFTYNGNPTLSFETNGGSRISAEVMILSHPAGGKNRPSLTEIKSNIIHRFGFRNSIITENDLTSYLEQEVDNLGLENTIKIEFRRHQDDIVARRLTSYLALKMDEGQVLPTTTCDMDIPAGRIEEGTGSLDPGTAIVFDRSMSRNNRPGIFRLVESSEDVLVYQTDRNSFLYSLPYLMVLQRFPFPRATLYNIFTEDTSAISISSGELEIGQRYFLNNVSIGRSFTEDGYKVEFILASNVVDNTMLYDGRYRFVVRVLDARNSLIGEILATASNNRFSFTLLTEDSFDSSGKSVGNKFARYRRR